MFTDSFWISPDVISDFFGWLFRGIGNFLAFIFGVGDPLFRVGGVGIYWLDILLAIMVASVILFYMVFSGKLSEIKKKREARIASMYLQSAPEVIQNQRWETISYLIRTPNPADWRVAIIDADTMLDDLFARLGYPGNTLGERMKSANKHTFPALNEAWEAHKVRNQIAHAGSGFVLDQRQALQTYYLYEKVFRESGYI